jgi:NAD(P)-dependent dehydrogenase (short-subunit alcohol dehydrogenase family)
MRLPKLSATPDSTSPPRRLMFHRACRFTLSLKRPRSSAKSPVSSTPQVSHLLRPLRKRSSSSIYGTALVLQEFGAVIARGGAGVVIASQSGHRLPPLSTEQNALLATTPVEELLHLPMLQPDQVKDSLHAYQISKRGNSLRVMAEAVRWGKRGARVNTISPGIIITPLANDELKGPRGPGYRRMLEVSAAGRAGTPDEVGTVGALLMGPDGAFITGSDFLMDGGVTAAYWFGDLAPKSV